MNDGRSIDTNFESPVTAGQVREFTSARWQYFPANLREDPLFFNSVGEFTHEVGSRLLVASTAFKGSDRRREVSKGPHNHS